MRRMQIVSPSKIAPYRQFLLSELEARKQTQRGYSMRDFARDLGLSVAQISLVLSGKRGLSVKSARTIMEHMNLQGEQALKFQLWVQAHSSRSKKDQQRAEKMLTVDQSKNLRLEEFHTISSCHHLALLEWLKRSQSLKRLTDVASELGLSSNEAQQAIERLQKIGLITIDGKRIAVTQDGLRVARDIPNTAVRRFHAGMLVRAQRSIETKPIQERYVESTVLNLSAKEKDEFIGKIRKFHTEILENFGKKRDQNQDDTKTYGFSTPLFQMVSEQINLTQENENEE